MSQPEPILEKVTEPAPVSPTVLYVSLLYVPYILYVPTIFSFCYFQMDGRRMALGVFHTDNVADNFESY